MTDWPWEQYRRTKRNDLEDIAVIGWPWRQQHLMNFALQMIWSWKYYGRHECSTAHSLTLKRNEMTLKTLQTAERNEGRTTDATTLPLVNDLDSSWRDGVLLCLLVDVLCSGCTTNTHKVNSTHRLRNCRFALQLANKHLQLPPVGSRVYCFFVVAQ